MLILGVSITVMHELRSHHISPSHGLSFIKQTLNKKEELLFSRSVVSLCDPMNCSSQTPLSFNISWSLLKLMSIESVMPSNHLCFCCPFLLLPSIFPSIKVFSNESALSIRWPKFWSLSFSIGPSNVHSVLISFRTDRC